MISTVHSEFKIFLQDHCTTQEQNTETPVQTHQVDEKYKKIQKYKNNKTGQQFVQSRVLVCMNTVVMETVP